MRFSIWIRSTDVAIASKKNLVTGLPLDDLKRKYNISDTSDARSKRLKLDGVEPSGNTTDSTKESTSESERPLSH